MQVREALGVGDREWQECSRTVYTNFLADEALDVRPSLAWGWVGAHCSGRRFRMQRPGRGPPQDSQNIGLSLPTLRLICTVAEGFLLVCLSIGWMLCLLSTCSHSTLRLFALVVRKHVLREKAWSLKQLTRYVWCQVWG